MRSSTSLLSSTPPPRALSVRFLVVSLPLLFISLFLYVLIRCFTYFCYFLLFKYISSRFSSYFRLFFVSFYLSTSLVFYYIFLFNFVTLFSHSRGYANEPPPLLPKKMAALPGAAVPHGATRCEPGSEPGLPASAERRTPVARFHNVRIAAFASSYELLPVRNLAFHLRAFEQRH